MTLHDMTLQLNICELQENDRRAHVLELVAMKFHMTAAKVLKSQSWCDLSCGFKINALEVMSKSIESLCWYGVDYNNSQKQERLHY